MRPNEMEPGDEELEYLADKDPLSHPHPAPTPDLRLTDEEIRNIIHAIEGEDFMILPSHIAIAQAQLSKVQQPRPTTEQVKEKLKDIVLRACLHWEKGDEEVVYGAIQQILRLLPFPDEQANEMITRQLPKFEQDVRQSERKAIGDWLEKNYMKIYDKYSEKYPMANRVTMTIMVLDEVIASLQAGEPPQEKQ